MATADDGWMYIRLINYRNNLRRIMWLYNAIYVPPPRRFQFMGYGVHREHELWLRGDRPVKVTE